MIVKDAELLRLLMVAADFTARRFAREMGWSSHSYLNRILAGEVRQVAPGTAQRMANLLQVPVTTIFAAPEPS